MSIRTLFNLEIERPIEPVVNYGTNAKREEALLTEVREYVTTAHIEERIEKLLEAVEDGANGNPNTEVGIWVSGFYGSGKSSFTKYLGMALDTNRQLAGRPFREQLADRLTLTLRQRLLTLTQRHPAAVVMLDLASEASGAMRLVHEELYRKVLQWADFSTEARTRDLELRLLRDGKLDAFKKRVPELPDAAGLSWAEVRDDPYSGIYVASQLAHEFYPARFPAADTLANTAELQIERGLDEDVATMLTLVRQKTGYQNVIFVIDEVGQYVAPVDDRITMLQGLAESLKRQGHALLIVTAQQTLTNDNPDAALNSAKLTKLLARFPMQLELKSGDISHIITERLLKKSAAGTTALHQLFEQVSQSLNHATRLQDVSVLRLPEFSRDRFVDLYPFLPQHFELMLRLLSRLATKHGGLGLRSALKLTQDMLLDTASGVAVADAPLGRLITLADFYRVLTLEIGRSLAYLTAAVDKARLVFGADSLMAEAAAAVAVLQIIEEVVPVTFVNVAALLQPDARHLRTPAEVKQALEELIAHVELPFALLNDQVRILSEEVKELETERNKLQPLAVDRLNLEREVLKELLPDTTRRTMLGGNRAVVAGLFWYPGADVLSPVAAGADPIQVVVTLLDPSEYQAQVSQLALRSTAPQEHNRLYACGQLPAGWNDQVRDLYRAGEIVRLNQHSARPGDEAQYVRSQQELTRRLLRDLGQKVRLSLESGSFIFRGSQTATRTEATTLPGALGKRLKDVTELTYEKYTLAGHPGAGETAVQFLQAKDLTTLPTQYDPLGLADANGAVRADHPALMAVADYLRRHLQADGRTLLDHFAAPPYGWSKDAIRYLVAALLRDGRVKLHTGGQSVSGSSPEARTAIGNTNGFNRITLRLADGVPSAELRNMAVHRLEELTDDTVSPTLNGINKAAREFFPGKLAQLAGLPSRLRAVQVPGPDRAEQVLTQVRSLLDGDDADVISRLGDPDNELVSNLGWADHLSRQLDEGLENTLRDLLPLRERLARLPDVVALTELRRAAADPLARLDELLTHDTFGGRTADLTTAHRQLVTALKAGVAALAKHQLDRLRQTATELRGSYTWNYLDVEAQTAIADALSDLALPYEQAHTGTLRDLEDLQNHGYSVEERLADLRRRVSEARPPAPPPSEVQEDGTPTPSVATPLRLRRRLTSADDLDQLIERLQRLRAGFVAGQAFEFDFED
ncbi:BREX system P-loop protein BrxC [Hymenobacter monticola]|uniref:BREX system P-loop protein BrxC n=1 Tax=Hymenobacter monticola TaxID=1705399 RepID=A0ABY4BCG2_9BACT|nr:BREX system P-loop protein BrxC [Hymenobacter monticola]UOE36765.1 BREX system P-loop protein BrxC [Hymenobacter monticola]